MHPFHWHQTVHHFIWNRIQSEKTLLKMIRVTEQPLPGQIKQMRFAVMCELLLFCGKTAVMRCFEALLRVSVEWSEGLLGSRQWRVVARQKTQSPHTPGLSHYPFLSGSYNTELCVCVCVCTVCKLRLQTCVLSSSAQLFKISLFTGAIIYSLLYWLEPMAGTFDINLTRAPWVHGTFWKESQSNREELGEDNIFLNSVVDAQTELLQLFLILLSS